MITIYRLKPGFQALLRPLATRLAGIGITANDVTLAAMFVSLALGAALLIFTEQRALFLLLPAWMFLRMALNAIDGMLAREFGQKSALGAYLNELSDVVSDAALYLPFTVVAPFGWNSVGAVIFLAAVSEMAGALGPMVGAERRYDGPMGKSDRALVFGTLGLWVGLTSTLPDWLAWLMPAIATLLVLNTINRIRHGVAQARQLNS
jgi:CDP-diacylglycerol--glycerol-3-phosphate 3-phosphatidyltransferase